jgi:hypothetical protein
MAQSRSPIKLAKQVSAIVGLQNAMSILFLERTSTPIKARSHSMLWKDHEKAVYMSVSQVFFINDLKTKSLLFGSGFYPIQTKTYPHRRE